MPPADYADLEITEHAGAVEFPVKAVPGASRTRVVGLLGGALKIAVSAPPEGGKANAALTAHLAQALRVGKGDVTVVAGLTQPRKRVRVTGLNAEETRARLSAHAN